MEIVQAAFKAKVFWGSKKESS